MMINLKKSILVSHNRKWLDKQAYAVSGKQSTVFYRAENSKR